MAIVQRLAMYDTTCISTGPNRTLCTGTQNPHLRHGAEMFRSGQTVEYRSYHVGRLDAHTQTLTHSHSHTMCNVDPSSELLPA